LKQNALQLRQYVLNGILLWKQAAMSIFLKMLYFLSYLHVTELKDVLYSFWDSFKGT